MVLSGSFSSWPLVLLSGCSACSLLLLQERCVLLRHPLLLLLQQLLHPAALRQHQPHVLQHHLDVCPHLCLCTPRAKPEQEQVDAEPSVLQKNSPGFLLIVLSLISVYTIFVEPDDEEKRVSSMVLHGSLAWDRCLLWMGKHVKITITSVYL